MLSPLFSGIDKHELGELFPDGTVTVKTLKKGDAVFTENAVENSTNSPMAHLRISLHSMDLGSRT